jgi:hypothetical protein
MVRAGNAGRDERGNTASHKDDDQPQVEPVKPPMAVSIAGVSTACSKDALVSSAKAVREALSTD